MKGIVGLLEYTVTGALFWALGLFGIALLVLSAGPEVPAKLLGLLPQLPDLKLRYPDAAKDAVSIVLVGLLFVVVFYTGFFLDLVGPFVFAAIEVDWARRMLLRHNAGWFADLIHAHGEQVAEDYKALVAQPAPKPPALFGWARYRGRPAIWQVSRYRRLSMFLISYVLGTAKGGQLEEFADRLKVWRVSQAIALSFLLLWLILAVGTQLTWFASTTYITVFIGTSIPTLLLVASYYGMRIAFYRFATCLESSAYLGWKASQKPVVTAQAAVAPSAEAPASGAARAALQA